MAAKTPKYKYDRQTLKLNKELVAMEKSFARLSREKSVGAGYAFIKLSRLRGAVNDRDLGIHEIYVIKDVDDDRWEICNCGLMILTAELEALTEEEWQAHPGHLRD